MSRPPVPPWWPTKDGEPLGIDRARELVAYLRDAAPPVIAFAKAHMEAQHPGHAVKVVASNATVLARQQLVPEAGDIAVGRLSIGSGGTMIAQAVVLLDRAGRVRVSFVAGRGQPQWTVSVW